MNLDNKKIYGCLFYVSLILYIVGRFLGYTVWMKDYSLIINIVKNASYISLMVCMFFCLVRYMFNSRGLFRVKSLSLILLVVFLFAYAMIFDVNCGFVCVAFAICATCVNVNSLFKFLYIMYSVLLSVGIVFGNAGENVFRRAFGDTSARYSFAFTHPYIMQVMWLAIVVTGIIHKRKKSLRYMVLMLIGAVVLNVLGGTRAPFISTVFLIIYDIMIQKGKNNDRNILTNPVIRFFTKHIYLICAVFFNLLCLLRVKGSDYKILNKIDYWFSGRISVTSRYIKGLCNGGIQLWPVNGDGVELSDYSLSSLALDSEYAQFLFGYGLIYAIVCIVLMEWFVAKAISQKQWDVVVVLVVMAINSIMEPTIMSILFNPCILLMFSNFNATKINNVRSS